MKIYDISQEVFGCAVYPGDPKPERQIMMRMSEGAVCNLSAFSMCAHNGTHVDAPLHFCNEGKSIDRMSLDRFVGYAYVVAHNGPILAADAERMVETAGDYDAGAAERILIPLERVTEEVIGRLGAEVGESDIYSGARTLNRALFLGFRELGVECPFTQVDVHSR